MNTDYKYMTNCNKQYIELCNEMLEWALDAGDERRNHAQSQKCLNAYYLFHDENHRNNLGDTRGTMGDVITFLFSDGYQIPFTVENVTKIAHAQWRCTVEPFYGDFTMIDNAIAYIFNNI